MLYIFVLSERQEGLHASLNVTPTETAFHGQEDWSTSFGQFLLVHNGIQDAVSWDYQSSNIVGDNLKK